MYKYWSTIYNPSFVKVLLMYYSLEPRITQSVRELGDLLLAIKGGGQVTLSQPTQRNAVAQDADEVLRPLMDLLDGKYIACIRFIPNSSEMSSLLI